ncbi:hypothetical protein JOE48_002941 [Methylobacterium sp. PvR107]|nr:hypothetical protein [Methylobacterium sp. PvR107]
MSPWTIRFDERPLGTLLALKATAAIEDWAAGIDDARRFA